MKTAQLTIRGFDKELERRIRALANQERLSLNQAALRLLRQATGLLGEDGSRPGGDRIGAALDEHIGTWTAEEAAELLRNTAVFEALDEEMWK
jgi:hypothetical protein